MLSLILLQQIAQLFIIIFLGWAIVKAGILKSEDSRVLSILLLYVIIPCVILNAFQIERTTDTVRMMELSLLSALMMNVLSLVLGRLSAKLFCLNTVETASVMYSNCTNMVVPLVIGIWGEDWVMYVTCYSIVQTILVWTHARILISGKKEISLRDLVCNVNILAIAIGLFLFAFQIRLPAVIRSAFAMAGNTMGPVAMLIIGMLMADMDMQHLRSYRQLWKPVLLRLIVLPVILVCVAKYSGLAALAFMHFGIGRDLATVLIKAILFSMLCVFTLMPGLLVLFSKLIDKTRHKNLIPKITAVGKFDIKTRFIIPPIFGVVIIAAAVFANLCPYCYTFTDLVTAKQNERQIAYQKIKNEFGSSNMVAVIVPAGNYEAEGAILDELDSCAEVKSTMGLANIEAMDGYVLTDALTPRQLAELADLDYEVAKALYGAYAVDHDEYGEIINGLDDYRVPLYDMFRFLEQEMHDGNITLSGDVQDTLDDLFDQLDEAQKQLQSDSYSRMVVYLNLPEETDETFAFVNRMHDIIGKYYDKDSFYVVGNTTSAMDLSSSFGEDNLLISVLSALFVILVLLFTFKSAGLPVLLIIVIQGSIWINFSVPYLQHTPLYFLGYLIVNSIQMGANIDYAIVISSHYTDLKKVMRPREAIVTALNESFPTIFPSGSILASAGILISVLTTNPVISAIGTCLGRGTIVSILLVLFVLPQILILGDTIIERTSFEMKGVAGMAHTASGTMHVNGRVRGYINGVVDADIKGVLHGQFSANIATGTEFTVDKPDMYLSEKNIHESEDGVPEPGTPDTPDTDTKGGDAE